MNEIWKDVKGFGGLYQVSNYGNVRSLTRYKKTLKPWVDKDGYNTVQLKHKGKVKHCRVSRLVAAAFVENPLNKNTVNHIDMNRKNDNADNLEWCTEKENVLHSYNHGKYKGQNPKAVMQFEEDVYVRTWDSMSEASRSLNIPVSNISYCLSGKRERAGGFKWKAVSTEVYITEVNEDATQ